MKIITDKYSPKLGLVTDNFISEEESIVLWVNPKTEIGRLLANGLDSLSFDLFNLLYQALAFEYVAKTGLSWRECPNWKYQRCKKCDACDIGSWFEDYYPQLPCN